MPVAQPSGSNPGRWVRRHAGGWGMVGLALAVGVGSGAGAVAFRYLIRAFTWVFAGHGTIGAGGHPTNSQLPWLGIFVVLVAPVVGGLVYGPLVSRFAPEARGHGVPEVMLAVAELGGRIRPQVPLVKALASALCIGSGGSVGREGPIVQIGSALGSTLGQIARVPERRLRLLVACGAAGGIAATFNAPIAGVFFALEVILRDFQTEAFALVVLSSVTAAAIGRAVFGSAAFLSLPTFHVESVSDFPLYVLLGALAALVGVAFIRVLYGSEDLADRLWRGPQWLRPAAGGVLLGALLLGLPQMYGVGYPVLEAAIRSHYMIGFLVLLLAGKVLATSLTIAIGGSGGVFAPSLFMGAMLGSLFGQGVHAVVPGLVMSPGAFGLVGMGAVFAAAARAPITAVLIIFELTGDYTIILPLMLAVVVAAALSGLITRDTIYTLKLRRRGIDIDHVGRADVLRRVSVGEAMRAPPEPVGAGIPLSDLAARISLGEDTTLPVVDDGGAFAGIVTADEVSRAITQSCDGRIGGIAHPAPDLRADQTLEDAVVLLAESTDGGLPVLSPDGARLVGWLKQGDVLSAYLLRTRRASPGFVRTHNAAAATSAHRR